MTKSRADAHRSQIAQLSGYKNPFTAGQDAVIQRLTAAGYGPADIAEAVNHTPRQVATRLRLLAQTRKHLAARTGWPIPDPSKQSDWGPGFWSENYKFKPSK